MADSGCPMEPYHRDQPHIVARGLPRVSGTVEKRNGIDQGKGSDDVDWKYAMMYGLTMPLKNEIKLAPKGKMSMVSPGIPMAESALADAFLRESWTRQIPFGPSHFTLPDALAHDSLGAWRFDLFGAQPAHSSPCHPGSQQRFGPAAFSLPTTRNIHLLRLTAWLQQYYSNTGTHVTDTRLSQRYSNIADSATAVQVQIFDYYYATPSLDFLIPRDLDLFG
ncbi:hypothetical protein OG21DRAFT_1522571 [Imleria badia]|nr:hypothetical protein OG21DRAFT_1522571 [Imleria badia]